MDFKGKAKRLDDIDLPRIGARMNVGEDELHAIIDVESRGSGFDDQGRPIILFERHKFWEYLTPAERKKAGTLANKTPGGYGKSSEQYGKLERAMKINPKAAMYACSWGLFQIMGFNHKLAGYDTVEAMVQAFMDDEETHLDAAVTFIVNAKLDDNLRVHDWPGFAKGYNGPKYRINRYDERLAEAYAKWKRIKDTPFTTLPAPPAENVEVTIAPTPKPGETAIVVTPTGDTPLVEQSKKVSPTGWAAVGAFILSLIAGAIRYFGG